MEIEALAPERLEALVGAERAEEFRVTATRARTFLAGRRLLNVNSTATGGGVAELLQTALAYARGAGIDARWAVIKGDPDFFEITKRVHNHLYGAAGDHGPLGPVEHDRYAATMRDNADGLRAAINERDIVILHDPQTAGLCSTVRSAGAAVVWRCHIGREPPNEYSEEAWEFLRPYLEDVDAFVFTRAEFAPRWMDPEQLHVIPPSIDPFSTKNLLIEDAMVRSILSYAGLLGGTNDVPTMTFSRRDGSPGRIESRVNTLGTGAPPPPGVPLVVQVSRWDRMKDMAGVMQAFAADLASSSDAHLTLLGPEARGVSDDPEGGQVLDECLTAWRDLPEATRARVHLACIPMQDPDEVSIITNALQRYATIVTQKSLAEGFGLTVTEAMWKRRPIVATRVGGIVMQIRDGQDGLLVDDPQDLGSFARAVQRLLDDRTFAKRLAESAHQRVFDEFLGDRHLVRYAAVLAELPVH